jgi:hypothetical protein
MRTTTLSAALAASGLLAATLPYTPLHAQLRAHAGVVAGNAQFGPRFECATSGYTIGAPWFAGVVLPTEGIAACGLSGMVDDRTAIAGPLTAAAAASGPMASTGTFTGTSQARAGYWDLGVSASATATGDASTATYRQAAAYASFADDLTFSSPGVAPGSDGYTNFSFLIEGMMKGVGVAPYGQQGDVALAIFVNGILWGAFAGTVYADGLPYVRGGSTGLPGGFVLTPAAFGGAAVVTTTGYFGFTWGVPLHVEVAMGTSVSPCCFGASLASDFYNSAVLTGIEAYGPGGRVSDFFVRTTSGARVGADGLRGAATTAPEPATVWLTLLGLAALVCVRASRPRLATGDAAGAARRARRRRATSREVEAVLLHDE